MKENNENNKKLDGSDNLDSKNQIQLGNDGLSVVNTEKVISSGAEENSKIVNKYINFIIGKKAGMTQIFDENGVSYPVTVVDVEPNIITQIKTDVNDGYSSIQIGMGSIKSKNNKAYEGKFKANNIPTKSTLKEFRVSSSIVRHLKVGFEVTVGIFNLGDLVDVIGVSIGKGFAGVMKRHGFAGGRRSHGKNSVMRKAGSIGASADPARVWPGKAMAGRMGGNSVTVRNLSILRIDLENNRLFINGSIPGFNKGVVYIKS